MVLLSDQMLLAWQPAEPSEAQALVRAVQARASARAVTLPAPPEAPTNCCGNDCNGCVWDGYYSEISYWRDEAVLRWSD